MLIEAEESFPHKVVPKVVCLSCKRRLTLVFPANMTITECTCICGEKSLIGLSE